MTNERIPAATDSTPSKKTIGMEMNILNFICKVGSKITQYLGVSIPFSIRINGDKIALRTFSIIEWLLCIRGWENDWELSTRNYIVQNIKSYDFFIDIGANTGIYSILAAGVSKNTRVIAVEPVFSNCIAITQTRNMNNLENLYLLNAGLSSDFRLGEFYTPANQFYPCSGTLSKPIYKSASKLNHFLAFPGDILESIIADQKVLIKIDVEGHEEYVLRGLEKVFEASSCAVIIELLPDTADLYQFYLKFFGERSMSPFKLMEDGKAIPMGDSYPEFPTSKGIVFGLNILFLPSC